MAIGSFEVVVSNNNPSHTVANVKKYVFYPLLYVKANNYSISGFINNDTLSYLRIQPQEIDAV